MGIHKYGYNTSSSQLDIKSLSTRIPRTVGHGLDHCMGALYVLCSNMLNACVLQIV